jgi:dienelactone hydrolase
VALDTGLELLDPTAEREPTERRLADRLSSAGARVALLDIRKPRGDVFLDELEGLLRERGFEVERTAKPTFTKPAPADVRREIAERCDAVIEALAD